MRKLLRGAFVIGRRDFSATVLSKTFLFFLLGPLLPLLFGAIFGGIGASVAKSRERPVVAVIAVEADFARIQAARERLTEALDPDRVVRLARFDPQPDLEAQRKRLLATGDPPVQAVLSDVRGQPRLIGSVKPDGTTAGQLKLILANAFAEGEPVSIAVTSTRSSSGSRSRDQAMTGQIGQMILFFLTLLLSTMLLSQMVEEKSNKIIEVVAAAVPIESLFVGKLFAMAAASLLGLIVWGAAGAGLIAAFKGVGGLVALPPPAVGWPAFLLLAATYFAMNYLLFGAVFLTIGAQAATVREVQTLSMPVTFGQILIFAFAAAAVGSPGSTTALAAEVFPLSSPLAMVGRAAQDSAIGPHIAAIAWQILWIGVILRLGAALFRKTVLKSGPRAKWWRRAGKKLPVAEPS